MLGDGVRNLLIFVALLGGVVFIHELGHYLAALLCGVKAKEFGLGLPPRLLRLGTWRGTALTLNWIPLGGFVHLEGEYDSALAGGLAASSPVRRLAVFAAGPGANFILGYLIFTLAFTLGWPEGVAVAEVAPGSPAQAAGLRPGDVVLRVDGVELQGSEHWLNLANAKIGHAMSLDVVRGETPLTVMMTPATAWSPEQRPTGVAVARHLVRHTLAAASLHAIDQVWRVIESTLVLPARLAQGQLQLQEVRLTSPVGLKQVSDRIVENTFKWQEAFPLLSLAGLVSVAIGFTNLLPIPALDGGHIAFVLLEVIRRKRLSAKHEKLAHVAGMAALYALMAGLVIQDLVKPLF
jgi:regulator of sigma E protease